MIKAKSDYDRRMDDSRFEKFDKAVDPSNNQKQYYILIAGIILLCGFFAITTSINYMNTSAQPGDITNYEKGLNISYNPDDKLFYILFSNPNNDTYNLATNIKIPFDSQSATVPYLTVYEYSTSNFPANITYAPASKASNIAHTVTVTLVKSTGNYTYAYSIIPDTENKMWQGTGQYINKIQEVFNQT